ncbi:conserved hypothetical protein [Leishmania infantum JPCM5]|uniref:Uncharacterized protein n=2 Tax=Leishmania infantum TaxID=5671 RepID=A4IAI6_LEIIN|nr:conserved hypothetical protein [Leishmania infantum JPCM5]CAC9541632.1 hypothetical_protein_-_conserved [Leishmania infantum]CAM71843.1 conserved hypothetical protein [Leishmania infantum JPCM5]SUZ45798.1 hypothetical_protein_-_conserved [Leishmania infantum]|eukprot:XP_001468755.1 conserved hypothetical protein [Leishmania infantum JPCM5]
MEALSRGFCAAALVQSLAPKEVEAWHRQWPQPTLQVVDIQRYPRVPTASRGTSRFYMAVSDSESVAWLVVPPCTALEDSVAAFEIEVGCCVTLLSHALVTAANGLNVVVPLEVKYSNNTLRLLGQPSCAEALFPLSAHSLLPRHNADDHTPCAAAASQRPLHAIALRDFMDAPQRALGNWCVTARVVWKGREYPLSSHASRLGGSSDPRRSVCAGSPRFVFRCLLADEHGDAVMAAFYGGEALVERVRLHGCYRLAQGMVKWGTGESGAPSELQFVEKSIEEELTSGATQQMFPFHASALVGEVAQQLRDVVAVSETAQVGGYVSVVGTVVVVQGNTQVTTKRGRVWRSVVTLASIAEHSAAAGRCSGPFVEVTLWGEVAEAVEPALGERWVFHPCAVHLFQQRKTLSSLASTMAVKLVPHTCGAKHAPRATASPGWEPDGGGADAVPSAVTAGMSVGSPKVLKKDMQLVLDLQEASPTLPVLARVQEVVRPFCDWMCTECCRTQQSVVTAGSIAAGKPTACAHCSAAQLCPTLRLRVWLSDGLCTGLAAFHGCAAESLLEASPAEVALDVERRSAFVDEMLDRLVGLPVLVWLLPCGGADSFDAAQFIVTNCKRIHYVSGAHTLLSAIDTFASLDEGVSSGAADVLAQTLPATGDTA